MATIDLDDVNFALRELVRLQLAGELSAEAAWRERQRLLDAVEAHWEEVPEQLSTASPDADVSPDAAAPVAMDSAAPVSRMQRVFAYAYQRVWPRLRELGLAWVLLALTLASCVYVALL